ncbi:hypothetical protein GCM10018793_22050 [Streptomyces sulfonofaciens]|uniref:Putative zinc-finger domain-containing protein n=1 Tax=Streptomyces sulfonofaciens TaxID=68272 RepID=A0A919G210_9ACTN|nr:zf-HC2 domain-containing protein [Streptomyces sulfonofaciens]GHH76416.1 hypothetical protein GCM10018793_22050 [Streptomyces sulfonofaciens]
MTAHGPGDPRVSPFMDDDVHETVGAYALGLLEPAEATAFEEHLAGCERCAEQLDELIGMGPVLAALAGLPGPADESGAPAPAPAAPARPTTRQAPPGAPPVPASGAVPLLPVTPGPQLADRLFADVAAHRARRRRRAGFLVAAAAALIVAGPVAVAGLGGGGGSAQQPPSAGAAGASDADLRQMPERVHATDAATNVSATLGLADTPWGTDTVLELRNLKGPLTCSLTAVGTDGTRQTVTSWSVPSFGYGLPGSSYPAAKHPLYVRGSAALDLDDIDHFEVATLDGRHLVTVDAPDAT